MRVHELALQGVQDAARRGIAAGLVAQALGGLGLVAPAHAQHLLFERRQSPRRRAGAYMEGESGTRAVTFMMPIVVGSHVILSQFYRLLPRAAKPRGCRTPAKDAGSVGKDL